MFLILGVILVGTLSTFLFRTIMVPLLNKMRFIIGTDRCLPNQATIQFLSMATSFFLAVFGFFISFTTWGSVAFIVWALVTPTLVFLLSALTSIILGILVSSKTFQIRNLEMIELCDCSPLKIARIIKHKKTSMLGYSLYRIEVVVSDGRVLSNHYLDEAKRDQDFTKIQLLFPEAYR